MGVAFYVAFSFLKTVVWNVQLNVVVYQICYKFVFRTLLLNIVLGVLVLKPLSLAFTVVVFLLKLAMCCGCCGLCFRRSKSTVVERNHHGQQYDPRQQSGGAMRPSQKQMNLKQSSVPVAPGKPQIKKRK